MKNKLKKLNNFFFLIVVGFSPVYAHTDIVEVKEGYDIQDLGKGLEALYLKLQFLENKVSKNSDSILANTQKIEEKISLDQTHISKLQSLENKVSKNSNAISLNSKRIEKLFSFRNEDDMNSSAIQPDLFQEQTSDLGINLTTSKIIVCSQNAHIRSTPKILKSKKNVVDLVKRGTELDYVSYKNKWYKLENGNYIHNSTCKEKKGLIK